MSLVATCDHNDARERRHRRLKGALICTPGTGSEIHVEPSSLERDGDWLARDSV